VKTVNVAMVTALSGPAAMWGLPGTTGVGILLDDVNAAGGLQVGDERYLVNLVTYDDENVATKAMMGAKKVILEDDAKFIAGLCDPPASAIAPLTTQYKVMFIPLCMPARPDRPYLLVGTDHCMRTDTMRGYWLATNHPEIERVAIINNDDIMGKQGEAYSVAGWRSAGVELSYVGRFSLDTTDFAPVMSAVLATNPDAIDTSVTYPEFAILLTEQAYLQGFEGIFAHLDSDLAATIARVPLGYLAGRYHESFAEMSDAVWGDPSPQHDFYRKWAAIYGPGAPHDQFRAMISVDWLYQNAVEVWMRGVEAAGTFDTDEVMAALRAMDEIPVMTGPHIWTDKIGLELYGIANVIEPPFFITTPILEPQPDAIGGDRKVLDTFRFSDWYSEHGDILLEELEERGLMYWQELEE
jgi:branched-chain amino acid transport system substrate-binding protein